jgi:hypothetical protein
MAALKSLIHPFNMSSCLFIKAIFFLDMVSPLNPICDKNTHLSLYRSRSSEMIDSYPKDNSELPGDESGSNLEMLSVGQAGPSNNPHIDLLWVSISLFLTGSGLLEGKCF